MPVKIRNGIIKRNGDSLTPIFPRFASDPCFCLSFNCITGLFATFMTGQSDYLVLVLTTIENCARQTFKTCNTDEKAQNVFYYLDNVSVRLNLLSLVTFPASNESKFSLTKITYFQLFSQPFNL